MAGENENPLRRRSYLWSVPILVFLASFGLTVFTTFYAARSARLKSRQNFEAAVFQAKAAVQTRMESYLALLRGGTAFYAGNPTVSRSEFHQYVERLRIPLYYPGIQGFGFSARLKEDETNKVVAAAHADGLTDFRLWPELPAGEERHCILYLEPMDKRNKAALGYSMFSEPVRRDAMEKARDSGVVVASGRVKLVQEIEGMVQAGFLIYAPVYAFGGVPPDLERRRAELVGFIYSPFRADDLFRNVFEEKTSNLLSIAIYDGTEVKAPALLHQSNPHSKQIRSIFPHEMETTVPLSIAERDWKMHCVWNGGVVTDWYLVPIVFAAGLIVSALLSMLTVFEGRARQRAEVANQQLKLSEQSLREARARLEEHAQQLEARVAERTAALRESVRDLEAVLYHVAHDLRAPVRAMGSFASILRDDYCERLDGRALGYLDRISQAASRMDHLVYDLLAYGRLAQMPVPLEAVALDKAVSLVLSRATDDLKSRSARAEVSSPMPYVAANPSVLTDLLSRLIDNAIKFAAQDRAPLVRIWAEDGPKVRVYVEDNGMGIRPEYHERIFRVFEKLHSGAAYPGTGIGLAIAKKAAERMGGSIGVESTPGKGSRFWIELPRANPDHGQTRHTENDPVEQDMQR